MIPITISNFIIYFSITWGANILLNILGSIKMHVPKVKKFDRPIDGGLEYQGERLIGESTTFIGLIIVIIVSVVLYFTTYNLIWVSIPLLVYAGHMLGSIVKRRMHKKDGEFVPFVDHGDYMILTGIVLAALHHITFLFAILSILVTYILHPIICYVAFKLKLRERPL